MPIEGDQAPREWCCATSISLIGNIGALTITALLFYLGAQPFAAGLIPTPWDKIAHFIVFATITTLLWLGHAGRRPLLILAMVCLIGTLDEWRQARLPGRSMDMADLAVDSGAAIFTLIVLHAMRRNSAATQVTQP
jgi:VanZ family protein